MNKHILKVVVVFWILGMFKRLRNINLSNGLKGSGWKTLSICRSRFYYYWTKCGPPKVAAFNKGPPRFSKDCHNNRGDQIDFKILGTMRLYFSSWCSIFFFSNVFFPKNPTTRSLVCCFFWVKKKNYRVLGFFREGWGWRPNHGDVILIPHSQHLATWLTVNPSKWKQTPLKIVTLRKKNAGMKSAGEKEVGASRGSSLLTFPPIIMEVEYGSLQQSSIVNSQ